MSWEATAWAKKTRGHKGLASKVLLLVLADYHDDERGFAWPSQRRLADDCEMSIRTVKYALNWLEDAGFITTLQRGNQHQETRYRLNMGVALAQSYVGATSGSATIAPTGEGATYDRVKVQSTTGEGAIHVGTREQEGTREREHKRIIEADFPEWFITLSQDPRWHGKNPERYIKTIEAAYPGIRLDLEAHSAYEWLQSPKGLRKKVLRGFWVNWLKNVSAPRGQGGNRDSNGTGPNERASPGLSALAKYGGGNPPT